MNFTHYTLGEALSSTNETIKRNALSILRTLQRSEDPIKCMNERPTEIQRKTVWKCEGNRIYKNKDV